MMALQRIFVPFALFFVLLVVALAIRGTGWDGDAIVSIAQFEKLIHPQLYGTPDAGTIPKLLPIAAFGVFHAVTGSYAIHWLTIALMAFVVAKLVQLPAEHGGGLIWLVLPFLSPLWINIVLSGDNPALGAGFLILGIVSLLEARPNLAVAYFLLSDLSRPGAYPIIALLILLTWIPAFSPSVRGLNLLIAIPAFLLGLIHSALGYRLAYPSFADFLTETIYFPGLLVDAYAFKHDPAVVIAFLRQVWDSLPVVMPVWVMAFGVVGWIVSLRTKPIWTNALWGLCVVPLSILPVSAFVLGPLVNEQEYMLFLAPPFLAGVALLAGRLWALKSHTVSLAAFFVVALVVAGFDGSRLKGRFEVNPVSATATSVISATNWMSDPTTKLLIGHARERAGRPLVLLTSCDVITLLVDVSGSLSHLFIFSNEGAYSDWKRYLRDCNGMYFRKRDDDVLWPNDVLWANETTALQLAPPDIIYTTNDGIEWLGNVDLTQYERHNLRSGRILMIKSDR